MAESPLVSVIIPCYNRQDYIAETIDSVLSQTWPNIELIVVDDGCTDDSRRILESYGDKIRLMEHPGRVNKGQSAAINVGLRVAKGEYVAILDSDDLFFPEKIEKQVLYLHSREELGIVYSNGINIDAQGKSLYSIYPPGNRRVVGPVEVLESCAFNLPSNALVRREFYSEAGFFDETLRSAQDHDMAIRLTEHGGAGYMDEVLWAYRRHGESVSRTRTLERWHNGFIILENACKRYPYPLKTRLRRRAVLHFRIGQCLMLEKNYLKALFHFSNAGLHDPVRLLAVVTGKEIISSPSS